MKTIHFSYFLTTRRMRRFNLSLLSTLAALALTACGGGGSDAPSSATASTGPTMLQEDGTSVTVPDNFPAAVAAPAPTSLSPAGAVSFINSDGVAIPAHLFKPAGSGMMPTVVMLHGCSGAFSYSNPALGLSSIYKEWAQRINASGYAALMVDSFTPRGTQNDCGNGTVGVNEAVDRPKDAKAALQWLIANGVAPANRIALLGWSNGASATLATLDITHATPGSPRFAGGISFYPGCGLLNNFGGISNSTWLPYAPLEIFHGSADPLYTAGSCDTRVNRAHTAGAVALNLTVYAGARHSFDQATSAKAPYTQADVNAKLAADAVAMQKLTALLSL